jgi:uncharacterized protein YjbI with pentapeptide repeats
VRHSGTVTTAADLKRRWYERENARLRMAVMVWLRGDGPKPDALGEIDGRVDLRGIPLTASPATFGDSEQPGSGVRWESLDLRRAQVDGLRFFGAHIADCLFDSASLLDLRLWGTEVVDCSFRRADLPSAALGTGEWCGRRNVWRRVAFDGANLRESFFTGCVLEACTFERNGYRLLIEDCEVVDCTFRGEWDSLLIAGHGHRYPVSPSGFSVDFSQATFNDSSITGYQLGRTKLPDQDDLIIIPAYPPVLRRAVDWLNTHATSDAENRARAMLQRRVEAPGADDSDLCFDLPGINDCALEDALRTALEHATR